jgi:hypothetical protein
VFIDLETRGATFWAAPNDEEEKFVKADYITLRKNRPLAKGQVRWLSGNPVILTAKLNDIKVTREVNVFIPVLLLLLCLAQLRHLKIFLPKSRGLSAPNLLFFCYRSLKMACSEDLPS